MDRISHVLVTRMEPDAEAVFSNIDIVKNLYYHCELFSSGAQGLFPTLCLGVTPYNVPQ